MIDFGRIILIGRHERIPEERRFLLHALTPMLERAAQAMRERWPDRLDAWERWNVLAWHVEGSIPQRLDLLSFTGLGDVPLPYLSERWVYAATVHHIDPYPVPDDPPLLHRSSQILDPAHMPPRLGKPKLPRAESKNQAERIRDLEDALDAEGLLNAPQAQTARGMERLLRWKGLRIVSKGMGWSLEQIPDDQRWAASVGGDCLDQILPSKINLTGPRGVSFAVESSGRAG